eukprot:2945446-Pleurochrysis_carterae.AAC.1
MFTTDAFNPFVSGRVDPHSGENERGAHAATLFTHRRDEHGGHERDVHNDAFNPFVSGRVDPHSGGNERGAHAAT